MLISDAPKSKDVDGVTPVKMLQYEEHRMRRRGSSISSLGNWTGAVIVSDSIVPVQKKSKGKL